MLIYHRGDATIPVGEGGKIILHICNDMGGWGRKNGFTAAINNRFPEVIKGLPSVAEFVYRTTSRCLGDVSFVPLPTADGSEMWIANMVAQHGYKSDRNPVPLDYTYLGRCLNYVQEFLDAMAILGKPLSVHCPRIGTGMSEGDWQLISRRLSTHIDTDVNVYEL